MENDKPGYEYKKRDKKKSPQEIGKLVDDMSKNGTRPIKLLFDNRKPLRDFYVKSMSDEDGGYLTGHERGQKRVQVVKYQDIRDVGT